MIKILKKKLQNNQKTFNASFLNPASYVIARKHIEIYKQLDKIYIDGWLLVLFLRIFCGIKVPRHSFDMTSLAPIVFNEAIQQSKSIYFIGTKKEVIEQFINNIKTNYPKLDVIGYRNGYFEHDERIIELKNITMLNPDIVIVGMGAPLQEQFLIDLKKEGWEGQGYTCGGFMHQTAYNIQYYPKWVDKMNLRMPYRIYAEPEFRKKIPSYFKFLYVFFIDLIKK